MPPESTPRKTRPRAPQPSENGDGASIGIGYPNCDLVDPEEAPPSPPRFRFLTSAEFASTQYKQDWAIKRILVKGQPGVIGAPKKSLKTTIAVELALSMGSGLPFLGEFHVPHLLKVAV